MKRFRKISDYAIIGGISAVIVGVLAGCDNTQSNQEKESSNIGNTLQKGAFVILEEGQDGTYKIAEEYPSAKTHVVVRDKDGNEKVLSQEEIDNLIKQEDKKIENGTSQLTNPNSSGGLGLGGAILASAAGAILGSYIGNKLFNNPAYKQNQQRNYKSPQAYQRSQNSFKNTASTSRTSTPANAKRGFFGSNSNSSSPRSSFFGS